VSDEPAIKIATGFSGGVSLVINADSHDELVQHYQAVINGPFRGFASEIEARVLGSAVQNVEAQLGGQLVHTPAPAAPNPGAVDPQYAQQYAAPTASPYPRPITDAQFAPAVHQIQAAPPPAVGIPYPGDCAHGPQRLVPAGVSKKTNRPYPAFWACQAPQGQQKCRG